MSTAASVSAAICERMLPGCRRPCRTVMHVELDALGAVRYVCHRCAWQQTGRCHRCGAARANAHGRTVYCLRCRDTALCASERRRQTDPDLQAQRRAADRARYREQPGRRAAMLDAARRCRARRVP